VLTRLTEAKYPTWISGQVRSRIQYHTKRQYRQYAPSRATAPIKNPARNGIALRREVSGCRQARPGLARPDLFIVKNCRINYSAPVSAEPEGKDL